VTFIEALLDGKQLEIHGDGGQTRSFTYVDDTVEGFVRALETPESRGEVVNVGSTETVSIVELAHLVQDSLGIPQPLRARFVGYDELPGNYQDVRDRVPDTAKAISLLGFEARVSLDDGLARTVAWHQATRLAPAVAAQ
jgi:UDP-glucose 4-epimerase